MSHSLINVAIAAIVNKAMRNVLLMYWLWISCEQVCPCFYKKHIALIKSFKMHSIINLEQDSRESSRICAGLELSLVAILAGHWL